MVGCVNSENNRQLKERNPLRTALEQNFSSVLNRLLLNIVEDKSLDHVFHMIQGFVPFAFIS